MSNARGLNFIFCQKCVSNTYWLISMIFQHYGFGPWQSLHTCAFETNLRPLALSLEDKPTILEILLR